MAGNRKGHALRIAVGITVMALLQAGGAGALPDLNISPQFDINNGFIMHRLDAGIPSHQDFRMSFKNQTGDLTGRGFNAESCYGRIPENRILPPVTSIEKAAGMISATAGWFINDNATGGDCTSIGTWNVASKTCTLTTDLTGTIEIDSDGITLDGNGHTITGSYLGSGIYLSGRNGVTIKNTNIRNFYYGIDLYNSSNNTLSGNNANSDNYIGVYLYNSSNNTLNGNNANSNNYYGISLYYSSNNTLSGNNANSNNMDGILLSIYSDHNTLSGNNANSNNWNGIYLYYSYNNELSGNNASNNDDHGIYLYYSYYNALSGNNASNNDDHGILSVHSNHNTLNGNNANSNDDGIYLDSSSNNALSGNNANSNTYYGIYLFLYSNHNTLSGNNASNNWYGIYLSGSSNNSIYNNFFNNTKNFGLFGMPTNNNWNTTKASSSNIVGGFYLGGNFWANPNGTGFSQTCTDADSDGICDSSYVLDTNNTDYLPLAYKTTTEIRGDVNRNGVLDTGDATLILRYIVDLSIPSEYLPILPTGDMNCNGIIDTGDATLVLRDIVGLDIPRCWE